MAAPVRLTKGTVEYFPVKVSDALQRLTTLTGKDLRFDITKADDAETSIESNVSGAVDTENTLIALCLIDTSAYTEGKYNLYIHFSLNPETPRLGPFQFIVDE